LNFDHSALQDERPNSACRQPVVPFGIDLGVEIRMGVVPSYRASTSAG
jgi:hypothetical protein